jgi:hypothetical protein
MLRASYGRFSQGVLTGEISPFHPGVTPITTRAFETATGDYTRLVRVVDSRTTLQLDPGIGAPHTDEYAIGLDREIGRRVAMAVAYIRKGGGHFIGWTDVGGQYREESRTLPDGRRVPVFVLVNSTLDQRFLLTNPDGYSLGYNGLVLAAERRRSRWWQAFGSYTFSRASGLQASSGETAAGAQASTVATPTRTFGRDPNDLTNARGRLPNDRPHMVRAMGTVEVPRTGLVIAANLQHFSGKPWAETALFALRQGDQPRPARTSGLAAAAVANAGRPACVQDDGLTWRGPPRAARGRPQRVERYRRRRAGHGQRAQPELRSARCPHGPASCDARRQADLGRQTAYGFGSSMRTMFEF